MQRKGGCADKKWLEELFAVKIDFIFISVQVYFKLKFKCETLKHYKYLKRSRKFLEKMAEFWKWCMMFENVNQN